MNNNLLANLTEAVLLKAGKKHVLRWRGFNTITAFDFEGKKVGQILLHLPSRSTFCDAASYNEEAYNAACDAVDAWLKQNEDACE